MGHPPISGPPPTGSEGGTEGYADSTESTHLPIRGNRIPPWHLLTNPAQQKQPSENRITPQQLVALAKPMINYDMVRTFGVVCKFVVHGHSGGTFYLDLKHGEGSVGEGDPPTPPDVTLTLTIDDFNALCRGEMNAFNAYMSGRLKVDGDVKAAMRMQDLVARIKKQMRANQAGHDYCDPRDQGSANIPNLMKNIVPDKLFGNFLQGHS